MERCQKDFEKLDMTKFEAKYTEKWTSVFYQIGFVFFLISCRLTLNSFLVWYTFIFRIKSILVI